MIPYGKQSIGDDDIQAVVDVMKSDFLTTGPKIEEFEKAFAGLVGSKHATVVSNGTAALHLACLASGLGPGDMLVTSPMTFVASANCAFYCGARPSFVDINERGLMDVKLLEKAINDRVKVIVPVHYAGFTCDMQRVHEIGRSRGITIIEDACHALGSKQGPDMTGSCKHSDMAVFSFHPVKHITTGEGGIITTNSSDLDSKLKLLRTHGIVKDESMMITDEGPWYYEMQQLGYNYRVTDIQAALGLSQLKKLEGFVRRRREIARVYDEAFIQSPHVDIIHDDPHNPSSYHLYPILLKDATRDGKRAIFSRMRQAGLGVQVHYLPVHRHPYYRMNGFHDASLPSSERFYLREISIPMYPSMTDEDVRRVVKSVNVACNEERVEGPLR